jgi:hypothetical protein
LTVTKTYRRPDNPQPEWLEMNCAENDTRIHLSKENYFIGADGLLMPTKKNQAPARFEVVWGTEELIGRRDIADTADPGAPEAQFDQSCPDPVLVLH